MEKNKKKRVLIIAIAGVVLITALSLGIGFRHQIAALFRGNDGNTQIQKSGGNVSSANPRDVQIEVLAHSTHAAVLTDTEAKKLCPDGCNGDNEVSKFVYGFKINWNDLTEGDKINAPVTSLKIDNDTTHADQFTIKYAFGTTEPTEVTGTSTEYTVTTADGTVYLYVSIEFTNTNANVPDDVAKAISGKSILFDIVTTVTKVQP